MQSLVYCCCLVALLLQHVVLVVDGASSCFSIKQPSPLLRDHVRHSNKSNGCQATTAAAARMTIRTQGQLHVSPPREQADEDNETMEIEKDSIATDGRIPEKLYNHKDWVDHRSVDKRWNDVENLALPMVALVVLYALVVAVVI